MQVNPTGQAAKTNLCVGDRILRVNDKDMQQATHHEAVAALISNDPEVKLLVRHDPPPPGIQVSPYFWFIVHVFLYVSLLSSSQVTSPTLF